jgi:IS30 family transposase
MRVFALAYIQHYITTGEFDAVKAAREAYTHKNMETLRVAACRVRKHPKMLEIINLFVNAKKSPQEIALEDLKRELTEIDRHLAASDAGSTAGQRLLSTRRETRKEIEKLAEQIAKGVQVAPPEPVVQTDPREPESRIPVGARGIRKDGILIGYKTPDGQVVRLAPVKADIR